MEIYKGKIQKTFGIKRKEDHFYHPHIYSHSGFFTDTIFLAFNVYCV